MIFKRNPEEEMEGESQQITAHICWVLSEELFRDMDVGHNHRGVERNDRYNRYEKLLYLDLATRLVRPPRRAEERALNMLGAVGATALRSRIRLLPVATQPTRQTSPHSSF